MTTLDPSPSSLVPGLLSPDAAKRIVWICVNGILTNPGDAEGWTDRAVTWLHLHTAGKAEKFEYACGAVTRRLRQGWRAQAISRMCDYYIRAGYEVVLIAHSNGGDLVERVLPLLWPTKVRSAHLFAPACDGDRLAQALDEEQLGALHIYGSPNDKALQFAGITRRLLTPVSGLWSLVFGRGASRRLGYGDLGRRALDFAQENPRATAHEDAKQSHSSWFERGEPFERTMRAILRNEFAEPSSR